MSYMNKGGALYGIFGPSDNAVGRAIINLNKLITVNTEAIMAMIPLAKKSMNKNLGLTGDERTEYNNMKKNLAGPLNDIAKEAKNVNASFFTSTPKGGKSKKSRSGRKSKTLKKR